MIYKLPQFESIPRITLFHFDIADVITSSPTDWHVILYVEANLRAFLTSSNILQAWFTLANANRVLLTLENANGLVTAFLLLTIQSLIGLWQAQTHSFIEMDSIQPSQVFLDASDPTERHFADT